MNVCVCVFLFNTKFEYSSDRRLIYFEAVNELAHVKEGIKEIKNKTKTIKRKTTS